MLPQIVIIQHNNYSFICLVYGTLEGNSILDLTAKFLVLIAPWLKLIERSIISPLAIIIGELVMDGSQMAR